MKKIILLLGIFTFFGNIFQVNAQDIDVKANIDSGTYQGVIEVYLHSNKDDAKIFYYTDGVGRFDDLQEFQKNTPLIISKETTLNFYAINDLNSSTKIQEKKYSFDYPKNFSFEIHPEKILLKNNSNNIVNIGYYTIEGENISYKVFKNTFLQPGEYFTLPYSPKVKENFSLFTPDSQKILTQTYIPQKQEENNTPPQVEITNISEEIISPEENLEENIIGEEENTAIQTPEIIPEMIQIQEQETIFSPENIKASTADVEQKEMNIFVLLYGFVAFVFILTCYNIFILVRHHQKIKKQKSKNKK